MFYRIAWRCGYPTPSAMFYAHEVTEDEQLEMLRVYTQEPFANNSVEMTLGFANMLQIEDKKRPDMHKMFFPFCDTTKEDELGDYDKSIKYHY